MDQVRLETVPSSLTLDRKTGNPTNKNLPALPIHGGIVTSGTNGNCFMASLLLCLNWRLPKDEDPVYGKHTMMYLALLHRLNTAYETVAGV